MIRLNWKLTSGPNVAGSALHLALTDNNLEQTWVVRVPANLALGMNIGVGDVRLSEFANSLDMEVGVGSVNVEVIDNNYRNIRLDVGVGDAQIRNFEDNVRSSRGFISDNARYTGNGEHSIDIEVGVGEVRVRNI